MSGIFQAPRRARISTSEELVQALTSLPEAEKALSILNLEHLFNLEKQKLVAFPEPSPTWFHESPRRYPQLGSAYITRVGDQVLASPLRVETEWSNPTPNSIQVSFNGTRCAGFIILV